VLQNLTIDLPTIEMPSFNFGGVDPRRALSFIEFVKRVNPKFKWFRHCLELAAVLQRVADGELKRLMVFMPPRHGKSEMVSRLFPAYFLYRHPNKWVGLNSYAAELSYGFSRNARDNFLEIGGALRSDASAVKEWVTTSGGGLWAAGVGGPITGKGFHLGIIDDPLKNAEEAASEKIRAKQKEWYSSTFYTRGEPNESIIICQTRWNEDDLSGWLLSEEAEDASPEEWHILHYEAIKEAHQPEYPQTCTLHKDWRSPHEPLCPERYPLERLTKIMRRIGSYFWNALFQQTPKPHEGNFFKRSWFEIINALPARCQFVRWWDHAATADGGDYTAGVLMARHRDEYIVVDVARGQWSSGERDKIIKQTADLDRQSYGYVPQWREQEPGSGGKDSALAFVRMLAGHTAHYEVSTGSKETRADPFRSQAEVGNVQMLAGDWNRAYLEELTSFPHGAHDDMVDASAGAFNKLAPASGIQIAANPLAGHRG
jgi:predicted phage terminase large subunit-like protein